MRYTIRELNLGAILDQAVSLTRDHLGVFLGITAVLLIPFQVISGFVQLSLAPTLPPNPTPEQAMAMLRSTTSMVLPITLLTLFVITPITNAALIFAVSDAYLGKPVSVGASFARAFQRILAIFGTWILVVLTTWVGLILCIVPGILAALWFGLATQVVVIERLAGVAAMKRSKALISGNIGTFFVLGFIVGIINIAVGFGISFIPQPHLRVIASAIIVAVLTVFASAVFVVFYFSCRCKHEQFDLELLAQSVGAEKPVGFGGEPIAEL